MNIYIHIVCVCACVYSAATLTVAAEGRGFDDLLWQGNNITVTGEQGDFCFWEVLHVSDFYAAYVLGH